MDSGDFHEELKATFRGEAQEHLQFMEAGLLALEAGGMATSESVTIVERIFRAVHSFKGAALAVELGAVESECQSLEDRFAHWKREGGAPAPGQVVEAQQQLQAIGRLVAGLAGAAVPEPVRETTVPQQAPSAPQASAYRAPAADTVRLRVEALDAQLLLAEEMLATKLAAERRVRDLRDLLSQLRSRTPLSDGVPDVRALTDRTVAVLRNAEQERDAVERLVDELLDRAKRLVLLPVASLTAGWPRLVRDLCREQGKEAELVVQGDDVEVDKRVLDTLKDPLLHMLRNSVDHGIEPPMERERRGKPARGRIVLSVEQVPGSQVRICLSDDGAGIDAAAVRSAAVRRGLLSAAEAEALPDAQARELVFRSDLSTRALVGRLSGRGLGLAIVQDKAQELGGQVRLHGSPGDGCTFEVVVPALRGTFHGVLVRSAGQLRVLPTLQVECVARVTPGELRMVNGRATLARGGRVLPLVSLAQVLGDAQAARGPVPPLGMPLVIMGRNEQAVALMVDEVLDEREFLVKPLLPPLARVRHLSAAAVLPDGSLAVVLDAPEVLRSAREGDGVPAVASGAEAPGEPPRHVLVAEDSITSRMLVKATLETAGYLVVTAVDGMDAWARLRSRPFDLLVSDVEMPRLDGFELTARVRANPATAHLPVVLVTSLEKPEDRERGLDAGADAYVVKSSFDQDTLLEAVRRLTGRPAQ